ncbi:MAG: fused MFS/spermidine synthase, partial [Sandaracinaceae bacterium]
MSSRSSALRGGISSRGISRSVAAYIAFFLSGASSLIFQTIWTRMLHHVFGAAPVAISTVLTVFMAGLGLGAWLGGKYAHRIKHPIITYAVAELGVGVWGLLIPFLVRSDGWLATVNAFLRAEFGAESGMFMIARFLCVAPILLVPTTLMGSTLPLLTRHFVATDHEARQAGAQVGVLYALNTFGAATGPLLSSFFLLPNYGLSITNLTACCMNFGLAALIFLTRRSLLEGSWTPGERLLFWPGTRKDEPKKAPPAEVEPIEAEADPEPVAEKKPRKKKRKKPKARAAEGASSETAAPKKQKKKRKKDNPAPRRDEELPIPELARKAAFFAFAASGAAALCYEVVWSRALAMTIGSSIYSFALILVTFLIGIAGGSAAMSSFLGGKSKPYIGVAFVSMVLVVLANIPWAVDIVDPSDTTHRFGGSITSYLLLCLVYIAPIVLALVWVYRRLAQERFEDMLFRDGVTVWRPLITVVMASIPVAAAVVNTLRFPGHLPKII